MNAREEGRAEGVRPIIVVCADGPLLVRGAIDLRDSRGEPVPAGRATIALCRCGSSTIKPFCDGSHKVLHLPLDQASSDQTLDQATSDKATPDE